MSLAPLECQRRARAFGPRTICTNNPAARTWPRNQQTLSIINYISAPLAAPTWTAHMRVFVAEGVRLLNSLYISLCISIRCGHAVQAMRATTLNASRDAWACRWGGLP